MGATSADLPRSRREPPPFERLALVRRAERSPFLVRLTLQGRSLASFVPPLPGGSVRLLLPDHPGAELVTPVWNGNQFLHSDGRRPVIRTLTPLDHDAGSGSLDVEVVLHGAGPLSQWAAGAEVGAQVALSGPGRGWDAGDRAGPFVVIGDESALPAIGQVVEAIGAHAAAEVIVEIGDPQAAVDIGDRPVSWLARRDGAAPGAALAEWLAATAVDPATTVWAAGEAAAMQRIRRHLDEVLGLARSQVTVRGYWKHGRAAS